MTETDSKAVAAWREAAADLGFQFTSPFLATAANGERFEALGLVHQFGGSIGTLISVDPEAELYPTVGSDYGVSYLGFTGYTRYDREVWIETLCDWGFWGERPPAWYSPGPNCHRDD